ncbi:MAG TPA: septum formation initiator family protein [Candidatus Saccharimonadales bacterium]|nr:septum formation initiator family protein [Candidatus Saccharimonadales bacterium]
MFEKIKNIVTSKTARQLVEVRNIGLYIFGIIVLAIAWSGAKTVQSNYDLQKQIATLRQQNAVAKLQNENIALQNQFYKTDEYLELMARQNLGLAAPGEKVLIVPKTVALKHIDNSLVTQPATAQPSAPDDRPTYVKNLEAWRDFLLGRQTLAN